MRYTILIRVPDGDGEFGSVEFVVRDEGFPVPRVGETIVLDSAGCLDLTVTDVRHWLHIEPPGRALAVVTEPTPDSVATLVNLLERGDGELEAWLQEFLPITDVQVVW